jgi:4-hydroxy-tetrahydrodipicolinate synthase
MSKDDQRGAPGAMGVMSITPFGADATIDETLLRSHMARFLPHDLSVYLCSQGSGEGLALATAEKQRVYEIGAEVLGGRREVVGAGIGLTGDTDRALREIDVLSATGVDAIQVFPPRPGALRPRDREIERYYDEVMDVAHCPVILGENVTLVGYEIGPRVLRAIIERHPTVAGLSWTVPGTGVASLTGIVTELGAQVPVRTGLLHHLGNMAALGGAGVLCFDGNVVPGLVAASWVEATTGGLGKGGAFGRLLALNAMLSRYGNPASIKTALQHLGLPAGHLRRPFLGLDDTERADLASQVDHIKLDAGRDC